MFDKLINTSVFDNISDLEKRVNEVGRLRKGTDVVAYTCTLEKRIEILEDRLNHLCNIIKTLENR